MPAPHLRRFGSRSWPKWLTNPRSHGPCFWSEFERFVGAERFGKFVTTVRGQARVENRLMYWQEALLREFCATSELPVP